MAGEIKGDKGRLKADTEELGRKKVLSFWQDPYTGPQRE